MKLPTGFRNCARSFGTSRLTPMPGPDGWMNSLKRLSKIFAPVEQSHWMKSSVGAKFPASCGKHRRCDIFVASASYKFQAP